MLGDHDVRDDDREGTGRLQPQGLAVAPGAFLDLVPTLRDGDVHELGFVVGIVALPERAADEVSRVGNARRVPPPPVDPVASVYLLGRPPRGCAMRRDEVAVDRGEDLLLAFRGPVRADEERVMCAQAVTPGRARIASADLQ